MAAQARHVDMWVTEGIISRDQAESICEFERRVTPSRVSAAEVLALASSAIAAGAAFAITADVWPQLSRMERIATLGLVAISLLTAGTMSSGSGSPALKRLGNTALFLAVPVVGGTVGVAAGAVAGPTTSLLMASVAAWMIAAPLYMWRRSVPQHIALFLATLSFVLSALMYPFAILPAILPGAVVFVVGAAWVAAVTSEWIPPRLAGEIAGAATALVGSMMLLIAFGTGLAGALAVAVAVSVGTVAFGVTRSRIVLTIVGIVALSSYVPWLVSEILGPSIVVPLTLVTAATALALWATRKAKKR